MSTLHFESLFFYISTNRKSLFYISTNTSKSINSDQPLPLSFLFTCYNALIYNWPFNIFFLQQIALIFDKITAKGAFSKF